MSSRPTTMLHALALVSQRERRRADVARHVIAVDVGVSPHTIARFERGEAWPADVEAIVNAVASRADVAPQEIWQAAIHAWDGRE